MTCISSPNNADKANVDWKLIYENGTGFPFQWVEFTPEQVCHVLPNNEWRYVIPSAFGCDINVNGIKLNSLAQDSLAQLLAVWGSAIAVTTSELANQAVDPFDGTPITFKESPSWTWSSVSKTENFKADPFAFHSWENASELAFRDAGMAFNVPLPPLLEKERGLDIIIVLDASGDIHTNCGGNEIIKAAVWAEKSNCPFPISVKDLIAIKKKGELKTAQLFNKQGAPTVLYIPILISDEKLRIDTMDLDSNNLEKRKALFDRIQALWDSSKQGLKDVIKELLK